MANHFRAIKALAAFRQLLSNFEQKFQGKYFVLMETVIYLKNLYAFIILLQITNLSLDFSIALDVS